MCSHTEHEENSNFSSSSQLVNEYLLFWYLLEQSMQVVFLQQKHHLVCQMKIKEFDDEHEKCYPPCLTRQRVPLPQKNIWHQRRCLRTSTEANQQILCSVWTYRRRTYISPTNAAAGNHWQRCTALLLQPRDTQAHCSLLNLSCGEKCSSHFMPLSGSGTTPLFHF